MLASRSCAQVFAALPVEHVLPQQGGEGSHRGVVAPGADLPVEPIRPLFFGARMKALERNWLPAPECTTVPEGSRRVIAAVQRGYGWGGLQSRVDGVADVLPAWTSLIAEAAVPLGG